MRRLEEWDMGGRPVLIDRRKVATTTAALLDIVFINVHGAVSVRRRAFAVI